MRVRPDPSGLRGSPASALRSHHVGSAPPLPLQPSHTEWALDLPLLCSGVTRAKVVNCECLSHKHLRAVAERFENCTRGGPDTGRCVYSGSLGLLGVTLRRLHTTARVGRGPGRCDFAVPINTPQVTVSATADTGRCVFPRRSDAPTRHSGHSGRLSERCGARSVCLPGAAHVGPDCRWCSLRWRSGRYLPTLRQVRAGVGEVRSSVGNRYAELVTSWQQKH